MNIHDLCRIPEADYNSMMQQIRNRLAVAYDEGSPELSMP